MLGVDPKKINDDCYDLYLLKNVDVSSTVEKIMHAKTSTVQVKIIASFLSSLLPTAYSPEQQIQLAVNLILESKGKITVKKLTEQLHLTERTLQRRFVEHIGVSPKQFAKIIQFQASLSSLSDKTVSKLTEVVYESGYADQSHFIRSFKKYTGRKPSQLKKPK
jgi:AraC-like DNA-binding protein